MFCARIASFIIFQGVDLFLSTLLCIYTCPPRSSALKISLVSADAIIALLIIVTKVNFVCGKTLRISERVRPKLLSRKTAQEPI